MGIGRRRDAVQRDDALAGTRNSIDAYGETVREAESEPEEVGRSLRPPRGAGKVTARRPTGTKHSPRWYGQLLLAMLIIGMLIIVLNYLLVLPGSASPWYLALGLVTMFTGFYLFTHYK